MARERRRGADVTSRPILSWTRSCPHLLDGAVLDELLLRRRVPSSLIPTIVLLNAPPQSMLRAQVAFDAPPRFDGLLTRYRRLGAVHERRHRLGRRTSCRGWVRPRSPRSAERRATEFISERVDGLQSVDRRVVLRDRPTIFVDRPGTMLSLTPPPQGLRSVTGPR